jgi:hypothetical protein
VKKISIALIFLLALSINGCMTLGVKVIEHENHFQPQISSDLGIIYVYREPKHIGSRINLPIFINDQMVGGLSDSSYMVYESRPGELNIAAQSSSGARSERRVTVSGGDKHFLRFQIVDLFWKAVPRLEIVPNVEGEQAIQTLTYVTLSPVQ